MKAFATLILASLAITSSATVVSQEIPARAKPNYAQWVKYLTNICPKSAVDAVSHPNIAPIFKNRPADIGAIYACTM